MMNNQLFYIGLISSILLLSGCSPTGNTQRSVTQNNHNYDYRTLSPQRQKIIKAAYQSLGRPYKWAGKTPREGFDCSGLMYYTHQQSGINIPRTAGQQRDASRTISRRQLIPGDMIFFRTGKRSNHVGVYTGNGEFIHASTGSQRVKKDKLAHQYWQKSFVKYGTFL